MRKMVYTVNWNFLLVYTKDDGLKSGKQQKPKDVMMEMMLFDLAIHVGRTLLARICKHAGRRAGNKGQRTRTKWGKNFDTECTYNRPE